MSEAGLILLRRVLDRQERQKQQIIELRDRNAALELMLVTALMEMAVYHDELPSKFRRRWLLQHDPRHVELQGLSA